MVKEKNINQKIQPEQTKPMSCNPDHESYLESFHKHFVVGFKNSKSKIYLKATHSIEKTIQVTINYCKKYHLNITQLKTR